MSRVITQKKEVVFLIRLMNIRASTRRVGERFSGPPTQLLHFAFCLLTFAFNLTVKLPFSAALLAGGKSRRMGQDKALLPVEWEGKSVPLWDRQLSILKSIAPAELVISGPRKKGYSASIPVYADEWPGVGPLGGIATCLNRINNGLLLVLAIDLPRVQPSFLQRLLAGTEAACGIVPILNNHFEPLVAVYPKAALEQAVAQLRKHDYVLQHFAELLLEQRLVSGYKVETGEEYQLENWNRPEDLSRG
jgi:molybdenum cofactor guanylyltransferase